MGATAWERGDKDDGKESPFKVLVGPTTSFGRAPATAYSVRGKEVSKSRRSSVAKALEKLSATLDQCPNPPPSPICPTQALKEFEQALGPSN